MDGPADAPQSPHYHVPAEKIAFYHAHGWVVLEDVVPPLELARIAGVLADMIAGKIDTRRNRADLGGHADRVQPLTENIIQIAWPTDLSSALDENLLIQRSRAISDQLYGDAPGTWALDMNQFLVKMPHTDTDTPLHQDQSCAWRPCAAPLQPLGPLTPPTRPPPHTPLF